MIELLNIDCMEYMATLPDKAFDLAVVDPPYGIGEKLVNGGTWAKDRKKEYSGWDKVPPQGYFNELFRVSKHQIIFGGNYFNLPPCRCFIIWDKPQMRMPTMADCEYAWTSFDSVAKIASILQDHGAKRIHLAQKPIDLYFWILNKFAKPGQRILDTHLGSGSSAIAAHYFGCDFVGCEIDVDYFNAARERFDRETRQVAMW
jgi:site-specific DNA-methyltransferase (adenine-specific)